MNRILECALHYINRRQATRSLRVMVGAITPVQAILPGRGPKQACDAKERQRGTGGDHHKKAVVETLPQPDGKRARDVYDKQAKDRRKEGGKHGGFLQLGGEVATMPHAQKARDAGGVAAVVRSVDDVITVLEGVL